MIAGRAEESVAVATEGVEWARSVGAAGGYGRFIAGNLVDALVHLGRWDEAGALARGPTGCRRGRRQSPRFDRRGGCLPRSTRSPRRRPTGCSARAAFGSSHSSRRSSPGRSTPGSSSISLTAGRPSEAAEAAATGIERLDRVDDHYYLGDLLMLGARAEADLAEIARARRDEAAADQAVAVATRLRRAGARIRRQQPGRDAFGGRFESDAAVAAAEAQRAAGTADPTAWRHALEALGTTGPCLAHRLLALPAGRGAGRRHARRGARLRRRCPTPCPRRRRCQPSRSPAGSRRSRGALGSR